MKNGLSVSYNPSLSLYKMLKQAIFGAFLTMTGMTGACTSPLMIPPSSQAAIASPLETYLQENALELLEAHHLSRIRAACVSKEKTPQEMLPCSMVVKEMLEEEGAKNIEILQEGNSYPAVFGEFRSPFPDARTVLIGGHYDVQPAEEKGWTISLPFQPAIISLYGEQRLAGRGASDDGQAFTHLDAVVAYIRSGIPLPINVKFFYEGGEERGSADMNQVMAAHQDLLSANVAILTDSGNVQEGVPAITYRSRGIVSAYIRVKTGKNDPHSGEGGGVVCNALMALEKITSCLFDGKTQKVLIPGFYNDIQPLSPEEEKYIASIPFDENSFFRGGYGAVRLLPEKGKVKNAMWTEPTFEVHALYRGKDSRREVISHKDSNTTVTQAEAYVTMRLVPSQVPGKIADLFRRRVQEVATETCLLPDQISVEIEGADPPARVDNSNTYVQLRTKALEEMFGVPPQITPIGGTEPIVGYYGSVLKIPVIYDSFDTFKDNAHGNDESFSLKVWAAGVRSNIRTYELLAQERDNP